MADAQPKRKVKVDVTTMSPPALKRLREDIDCELRDHGDWIGHVTTAWDLSHYYGERPEGDEDDEKARTVLDALLDPDREVALFDDDYDFHMPSVCDADVEEILSKCAPSGYGDVKTATTKVDPAVRRSMETTDHPLIGATLDKARGKIATLAKEVFGVDDVDIRANKLIVYREGDHFATHIDTPNPNPVYLGTAVVEVQHEDGRAAGSGELEVKDRPDAWTRMPGVAVFAPYLPHRVTPVDKGETRVSVTFDLFRKEDAAAELPFKGEPGAGDEYPRMFEVAKAVREVLLKEAGMPPGVRRTHIGLVCNNRYSTHQMMYGADADLLKALDAMQLTSEVRDVFIRYHYTYCFDDEEPEQRADVFTRDGKVDDAPADVPFYMVNRRGALHLLNEQSEEGAEFTGNEARERTEDMLYYARALVVSLL